ncbi:MAG TPA: 5'-methylthioadenosine/adenosylhomocysteine nucleosidase [Ktedonobacteraceae bacterium]|nr:5'-methylthioadenosine/adenosylhomocysteine nucleosidase [Ktedonobacteraceae bacterium]
MQRIALVGAMEEEMEYYYERTTDRREVREGNFVFSEGMLFGQRVVMAFSGSGKVSAALTIQKLLDTYEDLAAVLMVGVAGALKNDLRIGDVVVSEDCAQYDLDITALGIRRGTIPDTGKRFIEADRHLLHLALQTPQNGHRVVRGRILSGDRFLTREETFECGYLFDELEGSAIEMEGAAVAQVCDFNHVPFLIIRTICSELEGNQEEQYRNSLNLVARNASDVVRTVLQASFE